MFLIKRLTIASFVFAALFLAGCASQPSNINDACVIFKENSGLFNSWYRASKKAKKKYGVPIPVMLATIHQESAFKKRAKPARKKVLGFIPGKRPSNAFGYTQALNSTWKDYKLKSGNSRARRTSFKHSVDFVGWYYTQSNKVNGIRLDDAYHLYITYYVGQGGYRSGAWKKRKDVQQVAQRVANRANTYRDQMNRCGYKP